MGKKNKVKNLMWKKEMETEQERRHKSFTKLGAVVFASEY